MLVLQLVTFTHISELSEESFDFFIANFRGQTANKDFTMTSFCLFRIDFLVIDYVFTGSGDLINRISLGIYNEGKATRTSRLWISFNIDALNIAILTEMFSKFLCK